MPQKREWEGAIVVRVAVVPWGLHSASNASYLQDVLTQPSRAEDAGVAPLLVAQRPAARLQLQARPVPTCFRRRLTAGALGQRL